MAKLPVLQKLRMEDFPEAPTWFSGIAYVINKFMDAIQSNFSNGITFQDNIKCQIYEATVDSSQMPYIFRKSINTKAKGVILLELTPTDGSALTAAAIPMFSETSDGGFKVDLVGMPTGKKCLMRLLII